MLYYIIKYEKQEGVEMTIEENERAAIGQRLREYADYTGLDYNDFAEAAGVSRSQLSNTMNGKQGPSADMIYNIGKAFNISIDWLLFGRGAMEKIDANSPLRSADPKTITRILGFLNHPEKIEEANKIIARIIESASEGTPK